MTFEFRDEKTLRRAPLNHAAERSQVDITPKQSSSAGRPLWGTCYVCPVPHPLRGDPEAHLRQVGETGDLLHVTVGLEDAEWVAA